MRMLRRPAALPLLLLLLAPWLPWLRRLWLWLSRPRRLRLCRLHSIWTWLLRHPRLLWLRL